MAHISAGQPGSGTGPGTDKLSVYTGPSLKSSVKTWSEHPNLASLNSLSDGSARLYFDDWGWPRLHTAQKQSLVQCPSQETQFLVKAGSESQGHKLPISKEPSL
jgi:hypothetical protein